MANKTLFKTPYGERKRNHCPNGNPVQNEYQYEIDNYGRKVLRKCGETNLYETIQSSLEETKIENILARAIAGDNSVFRPEGIYADVSTIPTNMIEARKAIQKMENLWKEVPNNIKAKYNMDMDEFIAKSGTEDWMKDMGLLGEVKEAAEDKKSPDTAGILGQVTQEKEKVTGGNANE